MTERNDRSWIGASALGFSITALVYGQVLWGLVPIPPRLDPIALRLGGWHEMASGVDAMDAAAGADFVAVEGYTIASELAWWLPGSVSVLGVDLRWSLFALPGMSVAGKSGLLIRDARRTDPPDPALWAEVEPIGSLNRTGAPAGFTVLRVVGATAAYVTELPHRP